VRYRMEKNSDSEQDKGIEREGRREKEKAGRDMERHVQAQRGKEHQGTGHRNCGKNRDGYRSGQAAGKGKNSNGLQDRDRG